MSWRRCLIPEELRGTKSEDPPEFVKHPITRFAADRADGAQPIALGFSKRLHRVVVRK